MRSQPVTMPGRRRAWGAAVDIQRRHGTFHHRYRDPEGGGWVVGLGSNPHDHMASRRCRCGPFAHVDPEHTGWSLGRSPPAGDDFLGQPGGVAVILPTAAEPPQPQAHALNGVMGEMWAGLKYAALNRAILRMLLSFATIALTARGIMELSPSIAATALSGDLRTMSLLMSSFAIGALAAGVVMARWAGWGRARHDHHHADGDVAGADRLRRIRSDCDRAHQRGRFGLHGCRKQYLG